MQLIAVKWKLLDNEFNCNKYYFIYYSYASNMAKLMLRGQYADKDIR